MTGFILAYATVAYWLFWHSLDMRLGETAALIAVRAALYLVAGPVMLLGLLLSVAYWRAVNRWEGRGL